MSKKNKPPTIFKQTAEYIIKNRPRFVAIEAQKFFKESFVKGGFTGSSFQPWEERTGPLGGKKILIGHRNTANLMQSVRILEQTDNIVRVGSDLVYSEIHNEGGTLTVTPQMKKYWWARYYEFAGKTNRSGRRGSGTKKKLNAKAEFCRNMALMKVGKKIKIPKRQYIGESETLIKQFHEWFAGEVGKATNNNKQ